MMIIKLFKDFDNSKFILENKIYDLILESKIEYFKDFEKVLRRIQHPIAYDLIDLIGKDIEISTNLFDLGESPGEVTFFSQNQITSQEDRYLVLDNTLSYFNFTNLFKLAGINDSLLEPIPNGTKVTLVKIWNAQNTNLIFHDIYQVLSDNNKTGFFVKDGLRKIETEIKGSPQKTFIGRLVQRVLKKINKNYTSKELEEFVNKFKSEVKILSDRMNGFKLVNGDDIAYWYLQSRYKEGYGTLQNSCMRYSRCQSYFGIYTENPEKVSLLILTDEKDDNLIVGRALVWKLDNGETFMDRIYYTLNDEEELFIKYALKNNWIFKSKNKILKNETDSYNEKLKVSLENARFDEYPYLDTLCYLNFEYDSNGYLTNNYYDSDLTLDVDNGRPGVCQYCGGDGDVECSECYGSGNISCDSCSGGGSVDCSECGGAGNFDCSECEGTGEVENEEGEMIECPRCDGESTIKCTDCNDGGVECPECYGNGEIECNYCDGRGRTDCPEC